MLNVIGSIFLGTISGISVASVRILPKTPTIKTIVVGAIIGGTVGSLVAYFNKYLYAEEISPF